MPKIAGQLQRDFFAALDAEFGFTLDVASTHGNALCADHYTRDEDGLTQPWNGVVWCNPPYGKAIGKWLRKAHEASLDGAPVVCLVPARTDTKWWHETAVKGEVRFIPGRLTFGNATSCAPFPSAVVVFRNANGVTE